MKLLSVRHWIKNRWNWIKKEHKSLNILLVVFQIVIAFWIGWSANRIGETANIIQRQNYEIQKALYDFEPQISGFVNGRIWVYEHQYQAVADIEVLINAPHTGNFTLIISQFYPYEQYIDLEEWNHLTLQESIRDTTFPQAYRFRAEVNLRASITPKQNLTVFAFYAGALEFEIVYCDVPENKMYLEYFNGSVWFQFSE